MPASRKINGLVKRTQPHRQQSRQRIHRRMISPRIMPVREAAATTIMVVVVVLGVVVAVVVVFIMVVMVETTETETFPIGETGATIGTMETAAMEAAITGEMVEVRTIRTTTAMDFPTMVVLMVGIMAEATTTRMETVAVLIGAQIDRVGQQVAAFRFLFLDDNFQK